MTAYLFWAVVLVTGNYLLAYEPPPDKTPSEKYLYCLDEFRACMEEGFQTKGEMEGKKLEIYEDFCAVFIRDERGCR